MALLVLKANVHALLVHSLPDRAFDLLVALHQAFNLDLLLDHVLQRLHFGLDSLAHSQKLRLLMFVLIHELGFIWCHVFLDSELIVIFLFFLAVEVFRGGGHAAQSLLSQSIDINHVLELLGEVLVEVQVERHLLPVLREDVAGEEDVQRVIDASPQVLDSLSVIFLLLALLFVLCGIFTASHVLLARLIKQVEPLRLRVRDEVADLLVGRGTLLEQHLEHFLGDGA